MGEPQSTCADCSTQLLPIKLVDATERAFGEGAYRVNLTYSTQDAKPPLGGWLGGLEPKGNVYGRLCTQCGRIFLYAVPMDS
jgi:hypothetical protein